MAPDYRPLTDPATVAANRAGALTPEQRAALGRQARTEMPVGFCSCLFMGIFGVGFLVPSLIAVLTLALSGQVPRVLALVAVPFVLIGAGALARAVATPVAVVRKARRLRDALATGRVAQGEGDVTFTRRGYVARLAGVRLDPPWAVRELNLLPGRYRFYYLPVACILLAAEPLEAVAHFQPPVAPAPDPLAGLPGYVPSPSPFATAPGIQPDPPDAPRAAVQEALARALGFSAGDLAVNREGRLTGRQRLRLLGPALGFVLFATPFAASSVVLFREVALPGTMGVGGWLFFGVFAAGTLFTLGLALRRLLDALMGTAWVIEGVAAGKIDDDGESTSYYYIVQADRERRFRVGALAYKALVSGLRYRIYYAARSRRVVSAEPL